MFKTPEFIRGRVLRKFNGAIMPDPVKNPSVNTIGEFITFTQEQRDAVGQLVDFNQNELPIILCWISNQTWALITTQRVISLLNGEISQVLVEECEGCHPIDALRPYVKKEGAISPHVVYSSKGNHMAMELPTGSAAVAFQGAVLVLSRLNTTKK